MRWPQLLPGGKAVLYTAGVAGQFEVGNVLVQGVGGEPRVVVRNGYYGHFVETGHILYVSHGSLFAAPFNADRLEVTGPAVQVVEGLSASAGTGSADFAVSRTGMPMDVPSKSNDDVISSTGTRSGAATPLLAVPGITTNPVFSPDGGRLAMEILTAPTSMCGCTTSRVRLRRESRTKIPTSPALSGRLADAEWRSG